MKAPTALPGTNTQRTRAYIVGAFFIVAAVTAIVAVVLYDPLLGDPQYVVSTAPNETSVLLGAAVELFTAFTVAGTAIALFPLLRKGNESVALGYTCGRLLEAALISAGIVSVLSVVTLNRSFLDAAAPDAASFLTAGESLVAFHDWTLLLGPNAVLGPNTFMVACCLHRLRLVPRPITILGFIGGPMIFTSAMAVLFGLYEQFSVLGGIAALPVFTFEMSLAAWLIIRGFKPNSPALQRTTPQSANEALA
jgi:hypothetical protein